DEVKFCTHYRIQGRTTERMPYDISGDVEPVYESVPGWKDSSSIDAGLATFVDHVERAVGVPVSMVSLGPGREQMVLRGMATAH
ncbi:MAG: adenylosuccinate synthetase, partial [Flavobacteriales bacterium]